MIKTVFSVLVLLFLTPGLIRAADDTSTASAMRSKPKNIILQIPLADQMRPKLPARDIHASSTAPFRLRCNWAVNPVGVQKFHPRLTWTPPQRNTLRHEVAYQIQVSSNPAEFRDSHSLVWDSGKVKENPDFLPQYNGPAFKPYHHYYWRVRVWGSHGWRSQWSRPASWMTGPLQAANWRGTWITYHPHITNAFYQNPNNADLAEAAPRLSGARWILAMGIAQAHTFNAPVGLYVLERRFTLPQHTAVSHATLTIAGDNFCRIGINGYVVMRKFGAPWEKPAVLAVGRYLRPGDNRIVVLLKNTGSTPNPAGLIARMRIHGADDYSKTIVTDAKWSAVPIKAGINWMAGVPRKDKAVVLAAWGHGPWHGVAARPQWVQNQPCPIFRKVFIVPADMRHAFMYMAGLGYWKVLINGHKVGKGELESTLYDYSKSVPYQSFNVTSLLRKGRRNVISIELGNGWYNVMERDVWGWQNAPWRAWPKVRMNLLMRAISGKSSWLATNNTWQAAAGPRLADGVYNGEVYDAALKIAGWDNPHKKLAAYPHAVVAKAPTGHLTAQLMPSCEVVQRLAPVSINEPKKHVFVVKFPQNMSGWVTLTARGKAGVPVVLKYGERLFANGLVNRNPISVFTYTGSFQADTIIPANGQVFTYHPNFAYNGFQYVQINGLASRHDIISIHADFIHTAFHRCGVFWCGNPLLNAIADATNRSYCSNFVGYPTDCPTREKDGWTGDAWLGSVQGMMTYNNQLGYAKWLNDFKDEQQPGGQLYLINPTPGWGNVNAPDWESAYEFVAWNQYRYQGDGEILREHYSGIKKYFLYTLAMYNHSQGNQWVLGDWATSSRRPPSVFFTSSCILYHDAILLSHMADVLGKAADTRIFAADAASIRKTFNSKYDKGHGLYSNGGQTAQAMPLYYGLVPTSQRAAVVDRLVTDVHARHNHLDVGILGAKCLFRVLSRFGHTALAYHIATQTTYPSYGQWILHGATTLWEGWGLHPSSMNHIMFGDILGWFYNDLAGIQPDWQSPGFRTIFIKPHPVRALPWAGATYDSRFGPISSQWRWHGKELHIHVIIPAASSALVTLPGVGVATVLCDGKPLRLSISEAPGVNGIKRSHGQIIVHVGPGNYLFSYKPINLP